jgi:hypothetical protein
MVANILILLFIGFMVYWWSGQGLFSSLLNLVATLLALVVAFSVWEPVVYGFLLRAMPEPAWGIGLLLPFGVSLIVLRVVIDKVIGGNLHFSPAIDKAGGALFGFLAGVLTIGVIIMGVEFSGVGDFFGYAGYDLDPTGGAKPASSLWVPADSIAASTVATFSDGAFAPLGSDDSLNNNFPPVSDHPGLAVQAAMFMQSAFVGQPGAIPARHSVRDENVNLAKAGYFVVKELPNNAIGNDKAKIALKPASPTVVVGVEIAVQGPGGSGAADADGVYRVTRGQVSLTYMNKDETTGTAFPIGYVQNGQAASLLAPGDYAYSSASDTVTHYWVFQVPPNATPKTIRVKGVRVNLPPKPSTDPAAVAALIRAPGSAVAGTAPGTPGSQAPALPTGLPSPGSAQLVTVSDRLPEAVSKNSLNTASIEFSDKGIVRGEGLVAGERGLGGNLAVTRFSHPENAVIVQVSLGTNTPESLLGKIMANATAVTQAPVLLDDAGNRYFAIGYLISQAGKYRIRFDAGDPIRALTQVPTNSASGDDRVSLIYQVQKNAVLKSFDLGNAQTQELNLRAVDIEDPEVQAEIERLREAKEKAEAEKAQKQQEQQEQPKPEQPAPPPQQ